MKFNLDLLKIFKESNYKKIVSSLSIKNISIVNIYYLTF